MEFEKRVLSITESDLDPTWFAQGTAQLEIAQQLVNMVNPDDPVGIESAYASAANQLLRQGVNRELVIETVKDIMNQQKSAWNNINKHIGASVTGRKFQLKMNAFSLNLFNADRIARQNEMQKEITQGPLF